jgi:hypothetical protein
VRRATKRNKKERRALEAIVQEKKKKAKKQRQAALVTKAKEFLATLTKEQQDELQQTGSVVVTRPSDLSVRERSIHL